MYGAISVSMYMDQSLYNASSNTYYYNGTSGPNHGVTLIGWDDAKVVPGAPAAGAWLIKNSWGTGWGDGGYFWLSYKDTQGVKGGFCFCDAVLASTYQKVDLYDDFGCVGSYASPERISAFTATSDQDLRAVQFWTMAEGAGYDVQIYDTFTGEHLGNLLGSVTGTSTYAGVHTVDLPAPVHLTAGDAFDVYLHVTNGDNTRWRGVGPSKVMIRPVRRPPARVTTALMEATGGLDDGQLDSEPLHQGPGHHDGPAGDDGGG